MSARVVILGGGFAGAYCAAALERLLPESAEIVLIDRNNYFVFYPLLIEAGTGRLEPRHTVVPLRAFLQRAAFRMAEVTGIDRSAGKLYYQLPGDGSSMSLHYDHLVIALGSVTRLPSLPGLHEYGFEMKSLADAVRLRDRAIQALEIADATRDLERRQMLLSFVVVGANFTGAELAGELNAFLTEASAHYPNVRASDRRVTLVELSDRILSALDPELSEYAIRQMERRGVRVLVNSTVTAILADRVRMTDGSDTLCSTVIWCAGIAPNPLIRRLGLPVDPRGYLLCRRDLRIEGEENIWGIGDCAVNLDAAGQPYPATAQHALREGQFLARNLARVLQGASPLPCDIQSRGALAALGCRSAVARVFGIKLSGFPAWFLWRTYYLLRMPGLVRKIRVAVDWTLDLLFEPNYVQLGIHRPAPGASSPPAAAPEAEVSAGQPRRAGGR